MPQHFPTNKIKKDEETKLLIKFFHQTVFVYSLPLLGAGAGWLLAYFGPWNVYTDLKLLYGGAIFGGMVAVGWIARNLMQGPKS